MGAFLSMLIILSLAVFCAWLSEAPDRAFRRQVAARQPLDDDAFYEKFYAGRGVPRELVDRLRGIYCTYLGCDPSRLHPAGFDKSIFKECDTADLVSQIERAFGVEIRDEQAEHMDGSFDSIIQFLVSTTASQVADPPPATQV